MAGPVTVAAVAMPAKFQFLNLKLPLRDSKRLSKNQRRQWLEYMRQSGVLAYAVAHVQPSVIDRINIANAANLAATRAVQKLVLKNGFRLERIRVMLDGSLYLTDKRFKTRTIVGGDERYSAIKLASIVAKNYRDRLMRRKAALFPKFDFGTHVGYGTRDHIRLLKKHGPTSLHRQSFIGNFV